MDDGCIKLSTRTGSVSDYNFTLKTAYIFRAAHMPVKRLFDVIIPFPQLYAESFCSLCREESPEERQQILL